MPWEGIEIFHHSPRKLRENSGDKGKEFTFTAELKFVCYISSKKILEKIVYMTSLCGAWRCSNRTCMTSAFLKVKKSVSWKTVCHKRGSCLRPCQLARNRTKWILQCNNQANELQLPSLVVASESSEPNDNELELKAVAYAFCKIFQPEICWNVTNRL